MENRNGYQQKKPTVYPDGTVRRPRPAQPRPVAVPPSSKVRNTMGAAPISTDRRPAPARRQAPAGRAPQSAGAVPNGSRPTDRAPQSAGAAQNGSRPAGRVPQSAGAAQNGSRPTGRAPQQGSAQPRGKQAGGRQPENRQQAANAPKRPANAQAQGAPRGQRPQPQKSKSGAKPRNDQSGKPRSNGWVIPEGSPIYTAQGRMYEPRREGAPSHSPSHGTANRTGHQNGRPASGPARQQAKGNGAAPPRRSPAVPKKNKKKRNIGAVILFWTRAFAVRLLIFFIITVILGLWWYHSEFYSDIGESGDKVTYYVDNGSGTSVTAGASYAWYGGVMYVDFSALYPQFNMAAVGSLDSMRFIIKLDGVRDSAGVGSEQYVIFTDGSRTANINGSAVVMQSRCRVIGEDIWVPLSFIENYMDGIDVDRAAGNYVVFTSPDKLEAEKANKESKNPKKLNAADYPINPDFRLKRSDMLDPVAYPE